MKDIKVVTACVSAICLGGVAVQAANPGEIVLADSLIRPEYTETKQLLPTKEVVVVTAKDIQNKGYKTLSDVLNDQPSINVGLNGYGSIDIRGQGSATAGNNLQVILDGAPITILTSHPYFNDYNYIPVEQIEKVEIIPSGGSVMYGGGAAGGIIQITTKMRELREPSNSLRLQTGGLQRSATAALGTRLGDKWTVQWNGTKEKKKYYFVDTYRNVDYQALALRYQASAKDSILLRYSGLREDGQFIANLQKSNFDRYGKNYRPRKWNNTIGLDEHGKKITKETSGYLNADRELDQWNVTYRHVPNERQEYSLDLFYQDGYFRNNQDYDKRMYNRTRGMRLKYRMAYGNDGRSNLVVGIDNYTQRARLAYNDYKYDRQNKNYYIKPLHFYYEKAVLAVYVSNLWRNNRWDVTTGIRHDRTDWSFDKTASASDGAGTRKTKEWAWDAGVAYHYNDIGHVYVHAERGFTQPDGLKVADDTGSDISPTTATNEHYMMYEAGLRDKIGASTVRLVAFWSHTDDQLDRWLAMTAGKGLERISLNLLETTRRGVEVSLSQQSGKWRVSEGYTYLRGKSRYNAGAAKKAEDFDKTLAELSQQSLQAVPKHKFTIRAEVRPNDKLTTGLRYSYVGRYNNFIRAEDADGNVVGSHALVDWDFAWQARSYLRVFGGINNLLNAKYAYYRSESTRGYYSLLPGDSRNWYFGVQYQF